jgi:hypothetical protein
MNRNYKEANGFVKLGYEELRMDLKVEKLSCKRIEGDVGTKLYGHIICTNLLERQDK